MSASVLSVRGSAHVSFGTLKLLNMSVCGEIKDVGLVPPLAKN